MKLVVELYLIGAIKDTILVECIESLLEIVNDTATEILVEMLTRLGNKIVGANLIARSDKKLTEEFILKACQKVFLLRHCQSLSSRVRFRIQDLIDSYEKDWHQKLADEEAEEPE